MVKYCPSCKKTKSAVEFGKSSSTEDGLFPCCLVCSRERSRRYRESAKGKATKEAYRKSEEGKAAWERYINSDKAKETLKRYWQSKRINHYSPKTKLMNIITDTEAAYIAGILDGEGTITISRKSGKKTTKRGYCFRFHVSVSSTDYELIEWLQNTTGLGSISKNSPPKEHSKFSWRWNLWSQQAQQLVEAALPYLVIKKAQAVLGVGFMNGRGTHNGTNGLTDKQWQFQIDHYEKFKELNKRGR